MVEHWRQLIDVAEHLVSPAAGRPSDAHIRRSISTSYYAMFHFLTEECGYQLLRMRDEDRHRRRIFARALTHRGIRTTMRKIKDERIDRGLKDFLGDGTSSGELPSAPDWARHAATSFIQAQDLRLQADYDLIAGLGVIEAERLRLTVETAVEVWMAAGDKRFKKALCLLMTLGGALPTHDG